MKAAVLSKPFDIVLQDMPIPQPGSNEVLLSMRAAGICGSDLHFYDGSHPYALYPNVYGHELAGSVEQVGSSVSKVKPGDRVAIEPSIPCGSCFACRSGKSNCCPDMQFIGAFGRQGGFAEYVVVPEACVHPLPDGMDFELGALCEPFTIGAQAISRANIQNGHTITILGIGPIGLTILILLKQLYQVQVCAVDVVEERLETARAFGADEIINPMHSDPVARIGEWTGGEYSNIVIEVAGLKRTMEQTIHMVSPGGRIVIVGLTKDDVSMPGILYTRKEIEIFGSRNSVNQFPFIIDFLHKHETLARRFISTTMPFDEIAAAFHLAKTKPNEINKIILNFERQDGEGGERVEQCVEIRRGENSAI
ncbi:zinc-binding alcohol dehydrogenase family protein [Paenibacillus cymbidii]|uniref:zinc-binding alcohol dehydrogenase family protein n=1 Tax=Paenibacillus cymbidii TaxID=1639034 RepID=UPI001080C1D1|nr:zinc-binding alcohol dehydrogenase family protein [Paenibacillus cymbidii]